MFASHLNSFACSGTQQVLEPQTTRYLLRALAGVRKGITPAPDLQYLTQVNANASGKQSGVSPPAELDFLNPEVHECDTVC